MILNKNVILNNIRKKIYQANRKIKQSQKPIERTIKSPLLDLIFFEIQWFEIQWKAFFYVIANWE